jgi:hypothetical protein
VTQRIAALKQQRLQLSIINDLTQKALCGKSLVEFIKTFWHCVEGGNRFIHGRVVDALAEHLQAVTDREIWHLLITMPPRHMKSLSVSVFWPAWVWGAKGIPSEQFVFNSYSSDNTTRDSRKCRKIIRDPEYQRWYGKSFICTKPVYTVDKDQDVKSRYDNDKGGYRIATSIKGLGTGEGGTIYVVDDAHKVAEAESDTKREDVIRWWRETAQTRLNDMETGRFVVIGQRVHYADLPGWIIENSNYEHLNLQAEYEKENHCKTLIWNDWRSKEGELLFPERFSQEKIEELKKHLGPYAAEAQLQQRPTPRKGGFFETDKIKTIDSLEKLGKNNISKIVRYWDKAGTLDGGARTAGVLMARMRDLSYVVFDVVKGQWGFAERERMIAETTKKDKERAEYINSLIEADDDIAPEDKNYISITSWIEQEPGSGGKESAQSTIINLAGFSVGRDPVRLKKEQRAEPYAGQIGAENVHIMKGAWNKEFIIEHEQFPKGKYKDQVDAASGGFRKIRVTISWG